MYYIKDDEDDNIKVRQETNLRSWSHPNISMDGRKLTENKNRTVCNFFPLKIDTIGWDLSFLYFSIEVVRLPIECEM